jgi:hypothetical protein
MRMIKTRIFLGMRVTQALESSVSDPGPGWQKLPTKKEKSSEISCFEVMDVLSAFPPCSLGVLYGGLGISKLQFVIKKILIFFSCNIFSIFDHQDPGSGTVFSLKC